MELSPSTRKYQVPATVITVGCALISICSNVLTDVADSQKWNLQSQALDAIAGEVDRETCWQSSDTIPITLGERVTLNGVGTFPTSCIERKATNQFAEIKYLNGQLIVTKVFSAKEVRSRIPIHNKENK